MENNQRASFFGLMRKIPGGIIIVPLFIGVILNTLIPNALQIGGIPADVLRSKMPFLGVVVKKDEDLETVRQHGI